MLRPALVRQEAVEPADRPDEPDPELPLDPFRSGGGELGCNSIDNRSPSRQFVVSSVYQATQELDSEGKKWS